MTPAEKQAARDRIAALVDDLTAPEPEDLTRDDRDECIVCHCALVTDDAPPHCLDCVPTDEHLEAWESRLKPKGEAK